MALFDFTPLPLDENYKPIQGTYRNMASGNKSVTTAGTRVQLISTATQAKRLDITANIGNTDVVTIGDSTVVGAQSGRKGVPIGNGNTYTFGITDLSLIYIDSISNGDGVSFNYFW